MGHASEQLGLLPEGGHKHRPPLHRFQSGASCRLELPEVASAEVGHGMGLQVTPDALNRIELGSVCRQILERDPPVLLLDVLIHQTRAMRLQAIPDNQKLAADHALERL